MAVISEVNNKAIIFWQEWNEEAEITGEPAILLQSYIHEISIKQGDNEVLLSTHELKPFIKLLQTIQKAL